MQQKTWAWILVAVIVIAAVGYFIYQNGGGRALSTLGNTSLRSLLTSNTAQQCAFNNGQSSGTIYVAGGKMRGDFTAQGSSAQSHMVIIGGFAYVWIDGVSAAYYMPFESLSATTTSQNTGGIDADAKVATNCKTWQVNQGLFDLPASVNFNKVGTTLPSGDMAPTTTQ